jgi:all-trans-retinol 13,14-reductase
MNPQNQEQIEPSINNNYDVIIIGAGLGGLTAGAKLAKEGRKVLLVEQHYVVGGCATIFKRKDFTFEFALQELDGLHNTDIKTKIFKELGVFDQVEFVKIEEFYRFKNNRLDFTMPNNTELAIEKLCTKFPQDEKGIRKYFQKINAIYEETIRLIEEQCKQLSFPPTLPFIYPNLAFAVNQNLGDFLDSIITDKELKLLLCGNINYYHTNPYRLSLLFYSFAQASYFHGSWYIKGGSQVLSNYLASIIKERNGDILLSHFVTKIMINKGQAVGIECESKPKGTVKQFFAQTIIANAAIPNLINLLPPPENNILQQKIKKSTTGSTFLTVFLGFNKKISQLGSIDYSLVRFDDDINSLADLNANNTAEYLKRNFAFVDYSQIDSGLAPPGKSVASFVMVDHLSDWEGLSLQDYQKKKEEIAQIAIQRLAKEIPGIQTEVEYYEVATAKTIKQYTLNPQGTPYGFAAIPSQVGLFRQPNQSSIPRLYFASAWTYPGHGFTGTIISGWLCANEVDRFLLQSKK